METKSLIRALALGALIAGGGIALFLFMYLFVLTELAPLLRLLGSLFTPIVVMALFIGALFFLRNRD
jgi:hypothetical protein